MNSETLRGILIMSGKILPQDDICFCGQRIGDHGRIRLWFCLQTVSVMVRQLK